MGYYKITRENILDRDRAGFPARSFFVEIPIALFWDGAVQLSS